MVEIKTEYPVKIGDEIKNNLIKHYAEDELGNRYYIKQVETGRIYEDAIDLYPCKYTYIVTTDTIKKDIVSNELLEEENDG